MMSGGSRGAVVFASSSSGSEGPVAVLVLSNGVFVGYVPVVVDGQHTPVEVLVGCSGFEQVTKVILPNVRFG